MKVVLVIALCLMLVSADDLLKSFQEITVGYGFLFEQHIVQTSDGYLLKLFRIPGTKGAEENGNRQPILIQHGIFDSADFVVSHGPTDSPAFRLVNEGYDVWVANSRGNKYSRQHKTLNPDKDAKFWDFSFEDMVEDYKTNIAYVLKETGFKKIPIIGHSQGTSSAYAGLSLDGSWFEERVTVFLSLGSVARLDQMSSLLLKLICSNPLVLDTVKLLGIQEMFAADFFTRATTKILCGTVPLI